MSGVVNICATTVLPVILADTAGWSQLMLTLEILLSTALQAAST